MKIAFMLEGPSAKAMLELIAPKIVPENVLANDQKYTVQKYWVQGRFLHI